MNIVEKIDVIKTDEYMGIKLVLKKYEYRSGETFVNWQIYPEYEPSLELEAILDGKNVGKIVYKGGYKEIIDGIFKQTIDRKMKYIIYDMLEDESMEFDGACFAQERLFSMLEYRS